MSQRKRNLKADWPPNAEREGEKIKLFQSLYSGKTRFEIRSLLSTHAATQLVWQLKKAIREIHAIERGQIEQQEKTLSS